MSWDGPQGLSWHLGTCSSPWSALRMGAAVCPAWSLGPSCQGSAHLDSQAQGVGQSSLAPSMLSATVLHPGGMLTRYQVGWAPWVSVSLRTGVYGGTEQRSRPCSQLCLSSQECQPLKNYAALHAILSALQSPAVCCLESTWGHIAWWVVLFLGPGHPSRQGHTYIWQCPFSPLGLPGRRQSLRTGMAGSESPCGLGHGFPCRNQFPTMSGMG